MPYIIPAMRKIIDRPLGDFTEDIDALDNYNISCLHGTSKKDIGNLNYIITKICLWWLGRSPNYEKYNAVIGALECAKLELYRRQISPYEDMKIEVNGDVER